MPRKERIQQFHKSPKAAKDYVEQSMKDSHSSLARDFSGLHVSSVRLSGDIGGRPNLPDKSGRKLYDIAFTGKRR